VSFFWYDWIDIKLLLGSDQVFFSFYSNDVFIFKFFLKWAFAAYWSCTWWSWNCYRFKDFSLILILLVWISFHELVIPGKIIFLGWISCPWAGDSRQKPYLLIRWILSLWVGNSRQNYYLSRGRGVLAVRGWNSSGGFLVYELVIPGRITIYPVEGECWW
jgi:hypothetical protein